MEDFGLRVAHDTPTIACDYPYVSPILLAQGTYRLPARILPRDGSTLLALQAELLADAYNVLEFEPQQVERFSNGVIEDSLYARLEQALDAASLDGRGGRLSCWTTSKKWCRGSRRAV